jgi:hypothetical protein
MRLALLALSLCCVAGTAIAQECSAQPPVRGSQFYWGSLEACGCEKVSPVSAASPDYARFQKVCSQWRERHPQPTVIVLTPAGASPEPAPSAATIGVTTPCATPA